MYQSAALNCPLKSPRFSFLLGGEYSHYASKFQFLLKFTWELIMQTYHSLRRFDNQESLSTLISSFNVSVELGNNFLISKHH